MPAPFIDLPSGKGIQFSFSTNSSGYSSNGCWGFTVVVYCNPKKLSAVGHRDVVGAAEYMRPFNAAIMSNRAREVECLSAQGTELQSSKHNKSPSRLNQLSLGFRFLVLGLGTTGGLFLAFLGGQYFDDEWRLLGASLFFGGLVLGLLSLGIFSWGLLL
jgi:hypothetical protein